ncbi:MAG TPA: chromosome segregation protein SMC [Xanthomonadaceae bacterium]|nr:chromosome segregation protein SMC [Xanthomonadaceae bacterium]
MRLSTIKLAGFKSFVDPTTLHLPVNMTAVVGPNGCGKSNIIDAVRWVMGESSASRLRGDQLIDVIFSGSSARKPVGAATVELVFDNSDGAIGGEYAGYAEISVKRTVSRDSISTYYLNGVRCRRRDITELFLGTGLGPRSYSIIEQGMIGQLIEARPEELRVYLEEAAGISRYKERRRETETRIRHTRENLDRLDDVREEVDKQLEHLKRQARQAEQYQKLKAEQRQKDAELKALEYRHLDAGLSGLREGLRAEEVALEGLVAEQRQVEAQIEASRFQQGEAQEALGRVQAEGYRVGAELARIEQQIQHQRELRHGLERSQAEAETSYTQLGAQIAEDETQLAAARSQIESAEPELERLAAHRAERTDALSAADAAVSDWQQRWDAHARETSEAGRAADVERTRIDYLERQALEAVHRREALEGERGGLGLDALAASLAEASERHEQEGAALEQRASEVERRKGLVAELTEAQRAQQAELAEVRKQVQAARGRLSSLEALQHAALGLEQGGGSAWLSARGLGGSARLGEVLDVDAGWETAVESVLGVLLEGAVVDRLEGHLDALALLQEGRLALVESGDGDFRAPADSLAARVRGPIAVLRLLADAIAVEDAAAAAPVRERLEDRRFVVTRAGELLGRGWARVARSGEAQRGALVREREIQSLREDIEALAGREAGLVARIDTGRSALLEAEQAREDAQRTLYLAHRSDAELAGQIESHQGRLQAARVRRERVDQELAQLRDAIAESEGQAREARGRLESTLARMGELERVRQALESEREELVARRESAREAARAASEQAHALELQLESVRTRIAALTQALARLGAQRSQLENRRQRLRTQLAEGDTPVERLAAERQAHLDQRVEVEKQLAAARSHLDGIEGELRGCEQRRHELDQQALQARDALGQRRLEEQALALQARSLQQAIESVGLEVEAVLASLPDQADPEGWQRSVENLENRIRRLEPVNLAAISEYGEQQQRKEYLDSQFADLTQALETLETAIRKIDRETRGRFKDTFDRVNSGLQELYPRLFGGGHAYLELTGEDLLEAGVTIMARPPGKRVSSISLLSGGEKALTAVALVFSIFRLNPAPFCLLDEVDAPLDEANIERFSQMLIEMSEKVQFLLVTHNKATMESAHQLAGVTMREPGVSRVVSVDLAEAARLAGAA